MRIRHILLYATSKETGAVDAAFQLARQHDATVTALFVVPIIRPTAMWGYLPDEEEAEKQMQQVRDRGNDLRQQLQLKAGKEEVPFKFNLVEGYPHEVLINSAKFADLTVLCKGGSAVINELVQDLLYESGHPVLLLPSEIAVEHIGQQVVIGWKSTAGTVRAVTSAIPVLAKSSSVTVTEVISKIGDIEHSSGNNLIKYLAHHDIEARLDRVAADTKVTTTPEIAGLLKSCERAHADLLVMGGYGHSKAREWIFGGVTEHMLDETPLPLLLMH